MTGSPAPFDFRARRPDPPLDRFVESIWYARGTVPYRRERIAPTGSTVGIAVLGEPLLITADAGDGEALHVDRGVVIGPHDRPVINEPLGETYALGVVGTPVGCAAAFGIEPRSIRGAAVAADEAWPIATALRTRLGRAADPERMLDALERALIDTLRPADDGLGRIERTVAILDAEPTRPIGAIADELGVSHGHLDREFTRIVGLTPRALARLLRMRRLLAGLDVRGAVAWADLSAELGWYDQAHLIRDFKRHTGVSPSTYLRAQRATYTDVEAGNAAGFVPEG